MKRQNVLADIKQRLYDKGFSPNVDESHKISRCPHPQYYLRKEAFDTREINRRLIYYTPDLECMYEDVRVKAESTTGYERRKKSIIYQDFFDEIKMRLFSQSEYVIFPLDKDYKSKRPDELKLYANISKGFYRILREEAEGGRTVAAQAYYYLCGVFYDDNYNQWAMKFDELYSKKHVTEYFAGIHVINNEVSPSDSDDIPSEINTYHNHHTTPNGLAKQNASQIPYDFIQTNKSCCLTNILFIAGFIIVIIFLSTSH